MDIRKNREGEEETERREEKRKRSGKEKGSVHKPSRAINSLSSLFCFPSPISSPPPPNTRYDKA